MQFNQREESVYVIEHKYPPREFIYLSSHKDNYKCYPRRDNTGILEYMKEGNLQKSDCFRFTLHKIFV